MFGSYTIGADRLGSTPIAGEFLVLTLPPEIIEVPFTLYQFQYRPASATDSGAVALSDSEFFHYWLGRAWHPIFAGDNIFDFAFHRTFTEHTGIRPLSPGMLESMRSLHVSSATLRVYVAHMVNYGLSGLTPNNQRTGAIQSFDLPITRFETDNNPDDYQATGTVTGNTYVTPNPANTADTFQRCVGVEGICTALLAHQGRLLTLGTNVRTFLGPFSTHAEVVRYSPFRSIHLAGFTFEVEEAPSLLGAGVSMNADELFLVKFQGGAVLLRSDLDNVHVLRLPQAEPTFGIVTRSIACPVGAIYASRNGIFAWRSGDESIRLSRQLDGMFYDYRDNPDAEQTEHFGRFAWFHPWLLVPGGWIYDSRTDSWWRLVNPVTYGPLPNVYYVGPITNQLYAFPYKLTPTANKVWSLFDNTVLASKWSFQGQPLVETRDRRVNVSQINIVAQCSPLTSGSCTISVTLTGRNEDGTAVTPVTEVFPLADNPNVQQVIRHVHRNFVARYVQYRILAEVGDGPAPKLHSISFGIREDARGLRS